MKNRIYNAGNPYQGDAKRVLCVCSAGLLRSPTAAIVLQREYGYNTRAAGVDTGHALIPVDEVLLSWAQEIVCMDGEQARRIDEMCYIYDIPKQYDTYVLNIPDRYPYMDKELQELISKHYDDIQIYKQ
jgi:predicted protein tyrosine phosphatase